MKLLITGGLGFIGSNFIKYILAKYPNYKVVNFDAETYAGNRDNLKEIENSPSYTFIHGDICDAKTVKEAMDGVDTVVHFAAESHVDRSILDPSVFVKTNILGTQVLLEEALSAKIKRFHHISTDEVFGALELDTPEKFMESTPYNPRSPYAASKAAADHLVRAYYTTYNLPITITNCADNYGPYQYPEKLISLAITNLLEDKKVPVYGDGRYVRDWLYVEDHCRAIDVVLEKGKIGETYCIGTDELEINNITLVKKILKLLGKGDDMLEFVKDRPGHDRRYAIDASKIKTQLGWQAKFGLDTGLAQTVNWYKDNQTWWKKLKDRDFETYYKKQYGESK